MFELENGIEPVVEIGSDKIYPLIFTPENMEKFWQRAKEYPTIYGHEILNDIQAFINLFFVQDAFGNYQSTGLFWVLNPELFTGVFLLENIQVERGIMKDAQIHYTFFDRRHNGREPLIKAMFKYVFEKYGFQRLSADIPNYTTQQARHFAQECGMVYEGKRRKCAFYRDTWFDVNLYGILKSEVLR